MNRPGFADGAELPVFEAPDSDGGGFFLSSNAGSGRSVEGIEIKVSKGLNGAGSGSSSCRSKAGVGSFISDGAVSGSKHSFTSGVRIKSSCCNSCRPSGTNSPVCSGGRAPQGIRVYDDVFGGPPRYLVPNYGGQQSAGSLHDDVFRTPIVKTSSRPSELPVFDPPSDDTEVFGGPPGGKLRKHATAVACEDALAGKTMILRDFLRCSGKSSRKTASESPSPGRSVKSKSPNLSPQMEKQAHRAPQFQMKDQFPNSISCSASSASSFSMNTVQGAMHLRGTSHVHTSSKTIDAFNVQNEAASQYLASSSSDSPERMSPNDFYTSEVANRVEMGDTRADVLDTENFLETSSGPTTTSSSFKEEGFLYEENGIEHIHVHSGIEQMHVSPGRDVGASQAQWVTVDHVQLVTEPSIVRPPTRPAPSLESNHRNSIRRRKLEIFSENQISENLETESFREYTIKDLDDLICEENSSLQDLICGSSPCWSGSSCSGTSVSHASYVPSEVKDASAFSPCMSVGREHMCSKGTGESTDEPEVNDACIQKQHSQPVNSSHNENGMLGNGKCGTDEIGKEPSCEQDRVESILRKDLRERKSFKILVQEVHDRMKIRNAAVELEDVTKVPLDKLEDDSRNKAAPSRHILGRVKQSQTSVFSEYEGVFKDNLFGLKGDLDASFRNTTSQDDCQSESSNEENGTKVRMDEEESSAKNIGIKANISSKEQAGKHSVAEDLDAAICQWVAGKQGNVRALISTLQYILWPEAGWKAISLTDIIDPVAVKKAYKKVALCLHPDKVQQKGATVEQKYLAQKVFDVIQDAWDKFTYESW